MGIFSRLVSRLVGPDIGANIFPSEALPIGATDPGWKRVSEVFPPCPDFDFISLDEGVRQLTGRLQPIFNQEFAGCCTASAFREARALSTANEALRHRPFGKQQFLSAEWLYGMARTRLMKPNPASPGCGLGDVALVAKTNGAVPQGAYPQANLTYYNPKTALAWERPGPPDGLLKFTTKPIDSYLAFTREEVLSALNARLAVVFAARWYFTATDSRGMIISTAIAPPNGHAMTIQGVMKENGKELWCIRNNQGQKIFSGKNHPRFPMRGTGLLPVEEMEATVFNRGAMFAVSGV